MGYAWRRQVRGSLTLNAKHSEERFVISLLMIFERLL
jgi:hypothetical protein